MKVLILFFVLGTSNPAFSQVPRVGDPEYTAQSRLMILRVVPGDKKMKLYFAGKKTGELDLKKQHRVLSVTASQIGASNQEDLQFRGEGDFYEVTKTPQKIKEPYELVVKSEIKGQPQPEELKVKIPVRKP